MEIKVMLIFKSVRKTEMVSFYTHLTGLVLAVPAAVILLLAKEDNAGNMYAIMVYCCSLIFMFSASCLYHAFKKKENDDCFWRKLDHFAIFVMIAGSYTPMSYIYLDGYLKWVIILVQWLLVLTGLLFKIFYLNAPRYLYTIIYLIMGWFVLIPLNEFMRIMPVDVMDLLWAGGFFYTAGAIIYALKKPNFFKGVVGFHEIFHVFIVLGAAAHYFMMYQAIHHI